MRCVGLPSGTSGKEPSCQFRRGEKRVQSLGGEDPLEEGMTTYSSILAWSITWVEELGLQSIGSVELDTTSMHTVRCVSLTSTL